MRAYNSLTVSQVVLDVIDDLLVFGDPVSPRGLKCWEFLNFVATVFEPDDGPVVCRDSEHNARMAKYLAAEKKLYDSGERRASEYAKHAKLWDAIKNPDGTINSAYGWLIERNDSACGRTQWDWAKYQLLDDLDTRQAVVHVNLPEHQWEGNKDFPCTMHLHFMIRCGKLHLTAVMRSCDVTRGLVYDMPYFISLQKRMVKELRFHKLGVDMGTYTHVAHSLHLYETEVAKARKMIGDVV